MTAREILYLFIGYLTVNSVDADKRRQVSFLQVRGLLQDSACDLGFSGLGVSSARLVP